jgi:hypothetical protein
LRTNPAYRIVAAAWPVGGEGRVYGVLESSSGEYSSHAIDERTALLAFTLQTPGAIPGFALDWLESNGGRELARLLLLGILEVEVEGGFQSGGLAVRALGLLAARAASSSLIGGLSVAAIEHAARSGLEEVDALASLLYRFNTKPLSAELEQELPNAAAVADFFGLNIARRAQVLARHWQLAVDGEDAPWRYFLSKSPVRQAAARKLYVNLPFRALPKLIPEITDVLVAIGAPSFKIGRSLRHIVRPDKLIVYVESLDELQRMAERLTPVVAKTAAQPTPFTAPIDAEGLLSWGIDPAGLNRASAESASYRTWLAVRIATALVDARRRVPEDQLASEVLDRLAADGLDTSTWAPNDRLWQLPS